jgi:hypothetical protein
MTDLPQQQSFYIFGKHETLMIPGSNGKAKAGYYYRCFSASDYSLLFSSYNFRSGKAGYLFFGEEEASPHVTIKLRKSFPLTGKIDIVDNVRKTLQGVVTRGRKFYDHDEQLIGRFADATSWKEHFGESAFDALGQLIFGLGDADSTGSNSNKFGLILGSQPAGQLRREELPFYPDPPTRTGPTATGKMMKKFLPKKIGSALFDNAPPLGWKLEVHKDAMPKDINLLLIATLMTIEINRW